MDGPKFGGNSMYMWNHTGCFIAPCLPKYTLQETEVDNVDTSQNWELYSCGNLEMANRLTLNSYKFLAFRFGS